MSAEVLAVSAAGSAARGATAYLNLESGDCHGEAAAVDALVRGGVERVVVGIRHPLRHLRSRGIGMLRNAGVRVGECARRAARSSGHVQYRAGWQGTVLHRRSARAVWVLLPQTRREAGCA